ncbi:unnamed protein product [Psylliodes chrysocephalus]|uniref:Major facilitator superfamily associated domain-containing protein n=1 Tax=Psylliodes chrysocephalus TaxID=3402493 RepID=A0A9P0CQ22_9CUCU|nr:unnamed protein product [Psylliodes chrysocephala]
MDSNENKHLDSLQTIKECTEPASEDLPNITITEDNEKHSQTSVFVKDIAITVIEQEKLQNAEERENISGKDHQTKITEKINSDDSKTAEGNRVKKLAAKEIIKTAIKSKKFTWKQKCSLIMLLTADFMCYCSMSIMAPFYPQEAANRGMTQSMAGFVFGYFALVIFLSSPIFGKLCPKLGVKFLFIIGLFTSGICTVIFGTLHHIEDYSGFTALSFVIRGFAALGSSAYSTAAYVIVINIFPDNAGAIRGVLETFVGLGLCAGPGIGGILFDVKCNLDGNSGSLTSLLKLTPIMMTCFVMVVVSMTWGFLDPTLEPHLIKFNLTTTAVGLIFLLTSGTYAISCPFWGWLSDRLDVYWWMMTVGLFGNSVILLFLGPCLSFLPEENGYTDDISTHSVIAGLWSSVYSLGEVLGPVLGGSLMQHYDFSNTCATFAALNFIVGTLATIMLVNRKQMSLKGNLLNVFQNVIKPDIYPCNGSVDIVIEKDHKVIETIKTK